MPHPVPSRLRRGCPASLATLWVACLLSFALLVGCSDEGAQAPGSAAPPAPAASKPTAASPEPAGAADEPSAEKPAPSHEDLVKRGRSVYMSNCIACHNQNPAQDGALGPAIAGSSHELIEARVLRAEYPPGYTPKRDSKAMIALPHLAGEIDALTAYLNSGS